MHKLKTDTHASLKNRHTCINQKQTYMHQLKTDTHA